MLSPRLLLLGLLLGAGCAATAAPPPPAAPVEPPLLGCWNGGDVLFRETTRPRAGGDAEILVIHDSGAWTLESARRQRRGCLDADQISLLESQLSSIRRAAPDAPTCAGAPTYDSLVEVPGVGAIHYSWPCARGPDDATAAAITTARDLTWRAEVESPPRS